MELTEFNEQLRAKAYGYGALASIILAIAAAFAGHWLLAIVCVGMTALLVANHFVYRRQAAIVKRLEESQANPRNPRSVYNVRGFLGAQQGVHWLSHTVLLALMLVTTVGAMYMPQGITHWSYFIPLLAFLNYQMHVATVVTAIYSIVFSTILIFAVDGFERIQVFFIYLVSLSITLAFVYLREIKEQQLKPLRRTDHLTLASTRDYLTQDLEKEIQRSEREGTDLSVFALRVDDISLEDLDEPRRNALLQQLGQLLHENLRLFEGYYRYEPEEFIVVLPLIGSKTAEKRATGLRQQIRAVFDKQRNAVTVGIGISTLNVDDTAESLIEQARRALKHARHKGPNQSVSFSQISQEGGLAH